ncbi:MAG: response regulator [Bryobacterales bacterium]|nr:response regulator [Bryobacterales bacterium]
MVAGLEATLSVLIVDDDATFRQRLLRAFVARGWEAHAAASAQEAMAMASEHSPDLVLLDLRLREDDGLELLPSLRALDDSSAIFILTGYGSIPTALTAAKRGADHYLSKPTDVDEITRAYTRFRGAEDSAAQEPHEVPSLARVEWEHIQRVLADCNGNISQTAKLLGIHRRSLQRKLIKYPPRR